MLEHFLFIGIRFISPGRREGQGMGEVERPTEGIKNLFFFLAEFSTFFSLKVTLITRKMWDIATLFLQLL